MPRASSAEAAATGQRVLDAAHRLFVDVGYAAASINDIARAAGVTRGAVQHHHRTKEALFRAVVARLDARINQAVSAAVASQPDAAHAVRAGCHALLDVITERSVARVMLIDGPAVLGFEEWRRVDTGNDSVRALRTGLAAASSAEPALADAMAQLLSGAVGDAALWIVENRDDASVRAAAHAALDTLLDAAVAA